MVFTSRALVQCQLNDGHGLTRRPLQQLTAQRSVFGELQIRCFAQQKTTKSGRGADSSSDSDSGSDSDDEFKERVLTTSK